MTISELIERLEALKAEHGDIQVIAYDHSHTGTRSSPLIHCPSAEIYDDNSIDRYVVIW